VRGAARGGESKEREARLLGAGALAPVAGLTEIGRIPASCQAGTARPAPAHRIDPTLPLGTRARGRVAVRGASSMPVPGLP
jgi:hypothetical protein